MYLTTNIKEVIKTLKRGGIIVYPTDTAYGLGAKFSEKSAAARIYKIKGRTKGKPLPVIVASLRMARKFFRVSRQELVLAKKYWPGPLSLLLERKIRNPKSEIRNKKEIPNSKFQIPNSIVVRVPDSKIARRLSRAIGEPIFSTSANLSGAGQCYSPREVIKQFANRLPLSIKGGRGGFFPDLIFNGARLRKKKPSTIIRVIGDKIEVLRQGPIRIPTDF